MTDPYPLDSSPSELARAVTPDEIAAAWDRELPGARTESITIITPIWRLAKLLADDRRRTLREMEIDPAVFDLISTLRRSGAPYRLTTRQLAERCLVTAGAISQRVQRAEAAGFVRRGGEHRRPEDPPRTVHVTLTDLGRDAGERFTRRLLARETGLISALGDEERAAMADSLRTLLADVTARLT